MLYKAYIARLHAPLNVISIQYSIHLFSYLRYLRLDCFSVIMPRCAMHHRHTVVCSCFGSSVRQILHIFMSGELQVLKIGQYAKNDILVR